MAHRQLYDRWGNLISSPNKRSRVTEHEISESDREDDEFNTDYEESVADKYRDPMAFLNSFKGYESDEEEEPEFSASDQSDEEEQDEEVSEASEDEQPTRKLKKVPKAVTTQKKREATGFDFSSLPKIDNNGLKYLPNMYYFPESQVCPVKPQNKISGETLPVLIQMPNGAFTCIAIPFEAVEETQKGKTALRLIKAKAFLISEILDEVKMEASVSGLGLEGFKKLLAKKPAEEEEEVDSDGESKPKPPTEAGYSQSKKKARTDFNSKGRVIRQVLEEDPTDMSIDGLLARTSKIRTVAKRKKYKVPRHEATFLQELFMPPIHKWDPAYKPSVTSLPIPFNSWVDDPPELNDYMLPGLRKNAGASGRANEPQTRWDHILVDWQKTSVHMAAGLTPFLAAELPDDVADFTNEMLAELKKKQMLAGIAAQGCNILFEEMGMRRRMNFYFEFKKSSEWKNLGFMKTVRMGKEILKQDISKAFNAVKATSRAHDKKVALTTNQNYNQLQATKPWASPDDVSTFNRGRGFPSQRGRGLHLRGSPRSGNVWNPRNDGYNSGGSGFGFQNQRNNGNKSGRGGYPIQNRPQGGGQQPSSFNVNQGGKNNNRGQGFQQKQKQQNKGFRGGGN